MTPVLRTGLLALALAGGMTGLGYASVPLYRAFCQATGFAGTTQKAEAAPAKELPQLAAAFADGVGQPGGDVLARAGNRADAAADLENGG